MSSAGRDIAVANLRASAYRLSSTPSKHLPHIAPQIASQLWSCRDLLATAGETNKQDNDISVVVHRFKTQLSTLLQDRTAEGRWSAVVLVKAAIEAGGLETLSKSNAWVRSLLAILKKPDPSSTRCLAIITLTRIFTLTWDHPNLVREITTPALPGFIASCLKNAGSQRCGAAELQIVLESFATLVPRHPTIYRTNETQFRSLLGRIISHNADGRHYGEAHRKTAQRVLILLHHCSPKHGAAAKWEETLKTTVEAAHSTCDRLMRSVVEHWQSTSEIQASVPQSVLYQGELEGEGNESLGLSGWQGMFGGSERLVVLLGLLDSHISDATSGTVTLRLGFISDLLTRILSTRAPSVRHQGSQANNQISKNERDALFGLLPRIHAVALRLFHTLLQRFNLAAMPILQPIVAQVMWIFRSEASDVTLRTVVYEILSSVLEVQGPHMLQDDVADIEPVIKACCQDLLSCEDGKITPDAKTNGITTRSPGTISGMIGQQATSQLSQPTHLSEPEKSAQALLPICLSSLNSTHVPGRLRTLLERTAILTQNEGSLLAAVLNPVQNKKKGGAQASLLPLLARQFPNAPEVEALLRPRMPFIRTGTIADGEEVSDDASDDGMLDHAINGDAGSEVSTDHSSIALYGSNALEKPGGDRNTAAIQIESVSTEVSPNVQQVFRVNEASEKRMAEPTSNDRAAKRLRASASAGEPTKQLNGSLPGADRDTLQSDVSVSVPTAQLQSSFLTAPESSQQPVASPIVPKSAVTKQSNDDDSDFEMPPLTLEQDTDFEDEDEE